MKKIDLETKVWWRIYKVITRLILWIIWLFAIMVTIELWSDNGWWGILYLLITVIITKWIWGLMIGVVLYIVYGNDRKIKNWKN